MSIHSSCRVFFSEVELLSGYLRSSFQCGLRIVLRWSDLISFDVRKSFEVSFSFFLFCVRDVCLRIVGFCLGFRVVVFGLRIPYFFEFEWIYKKYIYI